MLSYFQCQLNVMVSCLRLLIVPLKSSIVKSPLGVLLPSPKLKFDGFKNIQKLSFSFLFSTFQTT